MEEVDQPYGWPSVSHSKVVCGVRTFLIVSAAVIFQLVLTNLLPAYSFPYLLFYPAVFLAAWFCGTGSGIVTMLAGIVAGRYGFSINGPQVLVPVLTFFLTGALMTWMSHNYRTALWRAEVERNRLHSLFLQAPAIVNIQEGPDHIFTFVHPMMKSLLGGRDVARMTVREAMPEFAGQEFFEHLDRVYITGEPFIGQEKLMKVRQPDGALKESYFNFTYRPWHDLQGKIAGVLTFAVDVTDQVRARQLVEEALKARDEFLSIASHELKTPLSSIKMQIQMGQRALNKDEGLLSATRFKKIFSISARQIDRLTTLVNDFLDVSRIQSGRLKYNLEPMDLSILAKETCERYRDVALVEGSKLEYEGDDPVRGVWDAFRMEQVIVNLISNAIKYGAGKPIHVSVKERSGFALLEVQDSGIGIEKEKQSKIYDRFERAISAENISGLGLGLYITRFIIEGHGGTVHLTSELGRGSTFTVCLPL